MYRFGLASLSCYAILALACVLQGGWAYAALVWMTVFVWVMDRLPVQPQPPRAMSGALALSAVLALAHLALFPVAVLFLSAAGIDLAPGLALGLAVALCFGQVSNSNAHELIHRSERWARGLGVAIYVSLLFGHHCSAHKLVHHIWVASGKDPNSARPGEGFWRFLPRAWIGSFLAGWRAETMRRRNGTMHPYAVYIGGAFVMFLLAFLLAGGSGILVLLGLAGYAQMQLLLADYVQHYGLRRKAGPDGRLEPAGPRHSWNAPHWYSSAMMLNAPRHSDHHLNAMRPFPELRLTPDMPVWPYSMPVMATLATIPPLWRKVMDPRVRALALSDQ